MDQIEVILNRDTENHRGEKVPYQVPISAYPTDSHVIIVVSPGSGELKDGRNDRWMKLGKHFQDQRLGSLVTYNAPRPDGQVQLPWEPYSYKGASWNGLLLESLAHAVEYSLERAQEICGTVTPTLYLAGFSSGASAVGAVAFQYPEVKCILLLSAYDSVGDCFYDGVSQFPGDVYLAYGSEDPIAGFLAYVLSLGPMAASSFRVKQVPDCDHRFSGETNSKLVTKAFYWAFCGDDSFPDSAGFVDGSESPVAPE